MSFALIIRLRKKASSLAIALTCMVSMTGPNTAYSATLDLSDLPLFLVEGVAPNLVLTMDDSGSMAWAYIPDGTSNRNLTEYTANYFNAMYYDPSVDYRPALYPDGTSIGNGEVVGSSAYKSEADFYRVARYVFDLANNKRYSTYNARVNLSNKFRVIRNLYRTSVNYRENNRAAYYRQFDSTRSGCSNTNAVNNRNCYKKITVSSTSGALRARPEFGYVDSRDERTNFANWYQFYVNRLNAAKSVMSIAFSPTNISSSVRVARQALNRKRGPRSGNSGGGTTGGQQYIRKFDDSQRQYFYNWLFNIYASSGTPLVESMRVAGEFYRNSGNNSPYTVDPGGSAPDNRDEVACRLNTHILVTDGVWNGSSGTPSNFKRDHQSTSFPDGVSYSPTARPIYGKEQSSNQKSLSDMAFHYWATDLRGDLDNVVSPYFPSKSGVDETDYWNPQNDPANWQHMINYNVAFGLAGVVPLTTSVYNSLLAGTTYQDINNNNRSGWPNVNGSSGRVDDLYHAAINSRGNFFSATKPNELVTALVSIMNSLSARESSASSLDLNSGSISGGAGFYQARFSTTDWTGDLFARPLSMGDNSNACNSQTRGSVCDAVWDAGEVNQRTSSIWDNKNVFSINPSLALGAKGTKFRWNAINDEQRALLSNGDNKGELRLKYLRGALASEQNNGGPFRSRTTSDLGAIVHSSPTFVGNGIDAAGNLDLVLDDEIEGIGKPRHRDFVCTNPQFGDGFKISSCSSGTFNRKKMLYVGSNDGMLHGFDASLTSTTGGTRLINFVPNAVYKNLWRLTEPTFVSGSYVDGEIATSDAFYSNAWHTVLVGGLRTGGQAYYALDVTNPGQFSDEQDSNADSVVRWEFGDRNNVSGVANGAFGANGDKDMGYSFGEPLIVKSNYTGTGDGFGANNGRWVAIFSNGYNSTEMDGSHSTSGNAVLYVVDLETGTLIKKFDTKAGSFSAPNGLSSPTAVYNDDRETRHYTADYVYAGDLLGNVWKFDISSSNRNDWKIAQGTSNAPQSLMNAENAAGDPQPITGKIRVSSHPANKGGLMLYFGTGKYIEQSDNDSVGVQTFYGLWDQDLCTAASGTLACSDTSLSKIAKNHIAAADLNRANMLEQTITQEGVVGNDPSVQNSGFRVTSDHPISWRSGSSGDYGWYMDLVEGGNQLGERVVGRAALRGDTIVFATLVPSSEPCSSGGYGWIMALDRANGGTPDLQPFDHNGDGTIDDGDFGNDSATSGTRSESVLSNPSILVDGNNDKIAINTDKDPQVIDLQTGFSKGRHRWRQLQ